MVVKGILEAATLFKWLVRGNQAVTKGNHFAKINELK